MAGVNDNKSKMKTLFEQITPGIDSSISVMDINLPRFDGPYHFHPEMELTWIKSSAGKRFVGGHVSDYEPDDVVLVGANIPHCWKSMGTASPEKAQAIVIQFHTDFAGEVFLGLPELNKVQHLLKKTHTGIVVKGAAKAEIISKINQCASADSLHRLLRLIEVLDLIANSKESEPIDQQRTGFSASTVETKRFQKVFSYLIDHYQQEISLKTVAELANLTPTAFCRNFKSITRKTLMEVVAEFRINQACQLLRNTDKSVNAICFDCGFGNVSYFNKTFKAATGHTPLQYRNLFLD